MLRAVKKTVKIILHGINLQMIPRTLVQGDLNFPKWLVRVGKVHCVVVSCYLSRTNLIVKNSVASSPRY